MNMKKWKEAVLAADKKKAMPVLSFPCVQLMGITVKELIADSALQAKGMQTIAERCDTLASVGMMDLSVEAEVFGSTIKVSNDEVPTVVGRIIETPEDADNLKVPSVHSGRTGLYIKSVEEAVKNIKDRPVFCGVIGPFSLAGRLMDMTEIMANCYDEPDMVKVTLEKCTEFSIAYINEYKKAGANGVVMAEPAAGLLSPGLAEEFSCDYVKRIADAVKADDFLFVYHNCGPNVTFMTESFKKIGADIYHHGDASVMLDIIKKYPPDVIVGGNISPSNHFRNGTPEGIYKATTDLLNECGGYKNFLISSGCDIPPMSKWENIDSFFKAVKDYYK